MKWNNPIALDTETALIGCGLLAPPLACTATADAIDCTTAILAPDDRRVHAAFDSRCIVGANFAYDAGVYLSHAYTTGDGDLVELIFDAYADDRVRDIQLDQRLIDIADGCLDGHYDHSDIGPPKYVRHSYSLDALHQRYGGAPLDKDTWRMRYGELIGVPLSEWPDGALDYPAQDAIATLNVHLQQDHPTLVDSCNQARAALALHLMSCWGLRADVVHADRVIAFIVEATDRARAVCAGAGILTDTGKRRMSVIRDRVLKAYATRPILLTDAGVKAIGGDPRRTTRLPLTEIRARGLEKYVSTDGDVCTNSNDPVLEAVGFYGSSATRIKKATTLRRGATLPLQTRFDVLKETGRTSSKAPGGTMIGDNFQNFARASAYPRADADGWGLYATPTSKFRLSGPYPTRAAAAAVADSVDVRGCIVPEPGYVLCSVDYASAEAHTWAQVCLWAVGESRMADTLNSGKDPHLLFAAESLLGGVSYDVALAQYLAKDPATCDARQFAKVPNYGLPGMLGPMTFVEYAAGYGYAIDLLYAEFVHAAWRETWHEANPYFGWVKGHSDGSTCTLTQFVSGRIRGGCSVPAASNSFFQGLAADGAKSALLPIWRECITGRGPGGESPLHGTKPVLFAHDEVIAMVPEDVAHDAAYRMRDIMVESFNHYVPDVPVHAEPALMTRWHKGAKDVFDGNGRLIPWQPTY